MKTTTRKPSAKIVTVIARVTVKRNGHVIYLCRGSHGEQYNTTVINGKATGCTCPARKPCKHMDHCQNLEASRVAPQVQPEPVATIGEAMAQANEQMAAHIDQVAAEGDKAYTNEYDILGLTKDPVSMAYGSCGHLVKPEHEGDLCGACMSKLLFG